MAQDCPAHEAKETMIAWLICKLFHGRQSQQPRVERCYEGVYRQNGETYGFVFLATDPDDLVGALREWKGELSVLSIRECNRNKLET